MKTFVNLIHRHSVLILITAFLITAALAPGIRKITILQEAVENSFTAPNDLIRSVQSINRAFGVNTRTVAISIETQDNWHITDSHTLELISHMTSALKSVPAIRRETLLSLTSLSDVTSSDGSIESVPFIQHYPHDENEELALQKKLASNNFIYGRLISKDFKTTMIVAAVNDKVDLAEIHEQISKAIAPFRKAVPFTRVTLLGDPEVNFQLHHSIEQDIVIFVGVSILLILASFYLMFRTWHGVVLPLIAIVMGITWTMGIVGYYGEPISLLTATLPVVLVVIGSACSIHVFHNLLAETDKGVGFKTAFFQLMKKAFPPLMMSSLTTFIGGISLLAFNIRPIQHFGIFTAVGTAISVLIAIVIIPALYKVLKNPIRKIESSISMGIGVAKSISRQTLHHVHQVPVAGAVTEALTDTVNESIRGAILGGSAGLRKSMRKQQWIERSLSAIADLVVKHPRKVLVTTVGVVLLSLSCMTHLEIGFDNISLLPNGNPIKLAARRLDHAFNGTQSFEVMVDANRVNGILDPKLLERINRFEKASLHVEGVTYSFSAVDLLKRVQQLMNPESKAELPASPEATSQYLLLLGMSSSGLSLSNLVTSDYSKMKLLLSINTNDTKETQAIYYRLNDLARDTFGDSASVKFGGSPMVWVALMRYIVWGKIQNMLVCLLLILLTVAAVHRSIMRGLFTVLILPVGVFLNFGLMGYTGIRLDLATAIITSFAMGLGVEFSIHFISALRESFKRSKNVEDAVHQAITGPGRAITYNALCNMVGFSALLFSKFTAIHIFALLMCFSMLSLLLCSLVVLPATVCVFPPEFITQFRKSNRLPERKASFAMKFAFSSLIVAILSFGIIYADSKAADLPTPKELLRKSIQAVHTNNEESTYVMKLIGAGGDVATRKMHVWFKSKGQDQARLLLKFTEPADIRGTGFLTIVDEGKSADQWLYLPALKKTRRIKGGNMDESFLGSDFTMGDLSIEKEDGLQYKVEGIQKCDQSDCYLVVGTPPPGADAGSLAYSKKTIFIRKDNFISPRAEFFNPSGTLEKVLTAQGIHKEGKRWVADKIEMKNVLTNHTTVLEFEKRDAEKIPSDSVFTTNFLERN